MCVCVISILYIIYYIYRDILAQAPISVKFYLEKQRQHTTSLSGESLVCNAVMFKPQESGEINIEVLLICNKHVYTLYESLYIYIYIVCI